MKIISWNVLFREYEECFNPNSKILSHYSNDNERLLDIVYLLKNHVNSETIVCLQECNYSLFILLKNTFNISHEIFKINVNEEEENEEKENEEENEFLITLTPREMNFCIENICFNKYKRAFRSCFVLSNDNIRIINCHLKPQRYVKNLEVLSMFKLFSFDKRNIIAGDFNENYKTIFTKLKYKYTIPYFGHTYRKKSIDNILFNFYSKYDNLLINTELMSDHHMLLLEFDKS